MVLRYSLPALIAANAVSLVGNVLATVAVPWFVLETTGSAAKTGIAAFFTTLPLAFGALFGGTIADRVGHRVASVVTDLASAAAISAVPLLYGSIGSSSGTSHSSSSQPRSSTRRVNRPGRHSFHNWLSNRGGHSSGPRRCG